MSEARIRPMTEADVAPGLELVMQVFHRLVAPDFGPEGVASFVEWADHGAFAERLRGGFVDLVAVADDKNRVEDDKNRVEDERIVGLIEWMPPDHVAMLFVDPAVQGRGIGRRLFEEALARVRATHPDVETVHVHASRYAMAFYRRLGFRAAGPEQEENGIRYTPVRLEVAAS